MSVPESIPAAAAPATRPGGRGATRRSELFDSLVELVLAEGFAHLTLDDLAARLHCSKRTLYGLAGSKEELVRAVVVHFFRGATTQVERALAERTDPAGRLTAYLREVAEVLSPAAPAFFDDVAAFPPAAEVYERNTAAAARKIAELVEDGVASGVFRPVHVPFVADSVSAAMVRIQTRKVAGATGLEDAEAYARLAELLLHGVVAPG